MTSPKNVGKLHAVQTQIRIIREMITYQRQSKRGIDPKLKITLAQLKAQYDELINS